MVHSKWLGDWKSQEFDGHYIWGLTEITPLATVFSSRSHQDANFNKVSFKLLQINFKTMEQ